MADSLSSDGFFDALSSLPGSQQQALPSLPSPFLLRLLLWDPARLRQYLYPTPLPLLRKGV